MYGVVVLLVLWFSSTKVKSDHVAASLQLLVHGEILAKTFVTFNMNTKFKLSQFTLIFQLFSLFFLFIFRSGFRFCNVFGVPNKFFFLLYMHREFMGVLDMFFVKNRFLCLMMNHHLLLARVMGTRQAHGEERDHKMQGQQGCPWIWAWWQWRQLQLQGWNDDDPYQRQRPGDQQLCCCRAPAPKNK